MRYLKWKAPEAFSKTKVLEVRFWDWDTAFNSDGIHGDKVRYSDKAINWGTFEWQMWPFLKFTSLEHVKFVRNCDFHPVNLTKIHHKSDIGVQFVTERFREFFEKTKNTFVGGAPLATVEEKELSCA
jgi:hypothetical protein